MITEEKSETILLVELWKILWEKLGFWDCAVSEKVMQFIPNIQWICILLMLTMVVKLTFSLRTTLSIINNCSHFICKQ